MDSFSSPFSKNVVVSRNVQSAAALLRCFIQIEIITQTKNGRYNMLWSAFLNKFYRYLALCPQSTYLSVLIGHIADRSGNEYLM
jgi:hypothetical protein